MLLLRCEGQKGASRGPELCAFLENIYHKHWFMCPAHPFHLIISDSGAGSTSLELIVWHKAANFYLGPFLYQLFSLPVLVCGVLDFKVFWQNQWDLRTNLKEKWKMLWLVVQAALIRQLIMLLIYLFIGCLPAKINLAFLEFPLCNLIYIFGFYPKLPNHVFSRCPG